MATTLRLDGDWYHLRFHPHARWTRRNVGRSLVGFWAILVLSLPGPVLGTEGPDVCLLARAWFCPGSERPLVCLWGHRAELDVPCREAVDMRLGHLAELGLAPESPPPLLAEPSLLPFDTAEDRGLDARCLDCGGEPPIDVDEVVSLGLAPPEPTPCDEDIARLCALRFPGSFVRFHCLVEHCDSVSEACAKDVAARLAELELPLAKRRCAPDGQSAPPGP